MRRISPQISVTMERKPYKSTSKHTINLCPTTNFPDTQTKSIHVGSPVRFKMAQVYRVIQQLRGLVASSASSRIRRNIDFVVD